MKIESRTITIIIDAEEWKKCKKEFDEMRFNKLKFDYKTTPCLHDLLNSIDTVANNPAHKIDRKINTF